MTRRMLVMALLFSSMLIAPGLGVAEDGPGIPGDETPFSCQTCQGNLCASTYSTSEGYANCFTQRECQVVQNPACTAMMEFLGICNRSETFCVWSCTLAESCAFSSLATPPLW